MRPSVLLVTVFLLYSATVLAQVAIGTLTPDDGSVFEIESTTGAFIPPRMTDTQMEGIPTPLEGAVVYNTTNNSLFVRTNGGWTNYTNSTMVLNRSNGIFTIAEEDIYSNFPLTASNSLYTDTSVFEVISNGKIKIKRNGAYLVSASFSIQNLQPGSHKYIIAAFINGNLIKYLKRGFVDIPSEPNKSGQINKYFGTSGILMLPFKVGDILELKYVLNTDQSSLDARFFNIGVSKMQ